MNPRYSPCGRPAASSRMRGVGEDVAGEDVAGEDVVEDDQLPLVVKRDVDLCGHS